MINFRYHVVSLTAVFLALAIGLVVGTAALNGPVADSLKDKVNALRKDNQQMRQSVNSLQKELDMEEDFAAEMAPILLPGKLTGRRVLVLEPADRPASTPTACVKMLAARRRQRDRPGRRAGQVHQPGQQQQRCWSWPSPPPARPAPDRRPARQRARRGDLQRPAGQRPARPRRGHPAGHRRRPAGGARGVHQRRLPQHATDKVTGPAEAVVVVSGQPYVDKDSAKKDESVVKVAEQFDRTGAIVVGGNGSAGGNLVSVGPRRPGARPDHLHRRQRQHRPGPAGHRAGPGEQVTEKQGRPVRRRRQRRVAAA